MSDSSVKNIIFKEMDETHSQGNISIENIPKDIGIRGDLGIQISADGKVWICINGIAFLRFKPKE